MADVLFSDFPDRAELATNEYAYWNPDWPGSARSDVWEMTSGSLFAYHGCGYTGKLDGDAPDADSHPHTGSAVFRLNTRRTDFQNVTVQTEVKVLEYGQTPRTPPRAQDGVHLWLRYQSQYHLYLVSAYRRDGNVVVKKKIPGGPSNNGTYHELGPYRDVAPPPGEWATIAATATNTDDGAVLIELAINGATVLTCLDDGIGARPITKPGAVGIRGDNARFFFRRFRVAEAGVG